MCSFAKVFQKNLKSGCKDWLSCWEEKEKSGTWCMFKFTSQMCWYLCDQMYYCGRLKIERYMYPLAPRSCFFKSQIIMRFKHEHEFDCGVFYYINFVTAGNIWKLLLHLTFLFDTHDSLLKVSYKSTFAIHLKMATLTKILYVHLSIMVSRCLESSRFFRLRLNQQYCVTTC